jgi:hypothetical protein
MHVASWSYAGYSLYIICQSHKYLAKMYCSYSKVEEYESVIKK